jgi:glucokinase
MKYFIGVELGVKNINIGVVDKYGKLLRKDTLPTLKERPYQEIIKDIADLTFKVLKSENIDLKSVRFIGVGSPGIPNNDKGIIVRNYTLNFINTPIRAELQKHINLPVYIENDANCAALSESVAGAAEDIDFSVTIKIGTGIGGGIIINNKVYTGFNFAGAELGHMVISCGGEKCTCGRKGCWESYASATALIRHTREAAEQNPDSLIHKIVENDLSKINEFTAFEATKSGDQTAEKVFHQYIEYLAEGVVNIINILMPEVIIIGGEISKLGEYLLKPLRKMVYDRIYSKEILPPELKIAEMGSASIVIGAAMLGLYKDL